MRSRENIPEASSECMGCGGLRLAEVAIERQLYQGFLRDGPLPLPPMSTIPQESSTGGGVDRLIVMKQTTWMSPA